MSGPNRQVAAGVAIGLAAAMAMAWAAAAAGQPSEIGECRMIHGRMSLWNGAPTVRIWVVGTHRMLGVGDQDDPFARLPADARAKWEALRPEARWNVDLFGDYTVCALAPLRPGRVQPVALSGARNVTLRPRR